MLSVLGGATSPGLSAAELLPAVSKDKAGYINSKGQLVIPCVFESGKEFSAIRLDVTDGYAVDGKPFSEGLAAVKFGGNWGYIDRAGDFVIEPQFSEVSRFQKDLACVTVIEYTADVGRGFYFLIDRKGKRLRRLTSVCPRQFTEGFLQFCEWDKKAGVSRYGYVNTQGKTVIEPRFDQAIPFYHGLA